MRLGYGSTGGDLWAEALLKGCLDGNYGGRRAIADGLIKAFMCQVMSLKVGFGASDGLETGGSRASEIFWEFMSLLAEHHVKERSVAFYAGEMCLSANYLTVQEVACTLSFPNQSSFGKYFKKLVGVGPKAYREGSEGAKILGKCLADMGGM